MFSFDFSPFASSILYSFPSKVKSYVNLVEEEGGTVLCGEGKDEPLDLPEKNRSVC